MRKQFSFDHWFSGSRLALALCIGLLHTQASAAQSSDLSRWLNRQLVPQARDLLEQHPRFARRSVAVVNAGEDALGDAVVTVLYSQLAADSGIVLVAQTVEVPSAATTSVDQLPCRHNPSSELQLRVKTMTGRASGDRLTVELVDNLAQDTGQARLWQWTGGLSRTERRRAGEPRAPLPGNGSLESPWAAGDVESAARALSREIACGLRPSIATRLRLDWPQDLPLPALFRDTVNTSRHYLARYREIVIDHQQAADYVMGVELKPFRDDTWQLWLTGSPRIPMRDAVQAVAYFRVRDLQWPTGPGDSPGPLPTGEAGDYLAVEMLGAIQSERGRSRADLQVALRLVNRAEWPIAYSLRLSGGHFNHCVARPGYYRHDRYGLLSGTLAPGASEVRRLVVEGLEHRPYPWFGIPSCAGSSDLDALERYASQGHRVTEYVRWDM
jgi:hypothetical protein